MGPWLVKVLQISLGARRRDAVPADVSFAQTLGGLQAAFVERRNSLERERGGHAGAGLPELESDTALVF